MSFITPTIPEKIIVAKYNRKKVHYEVGCLNYENEKNEYIQQESWNKEITNANSVIELDNEPLSDFSLYLTHSHNWESITDHILIEDPRGFVVEITLGNFYYILNQVKLKKNYELPGEWVYAWDNDQLVLIPIKSAHYNLGLEKQKKKVIEQNPLTKKTIKVGATYEGEYNKQYIYIGYFTLYNNKHQLTEGKEANTVSIHAKKQPKKHLYYCLLHKKYMPMNIYDMKKVVTEDVDETVQKIVDGVHQTTLLEPFVLKRKHTVQTEEDLLRFMHLLRDNFDSIDEKSKLTFLTMNDDLHLDVSFVQKAVTPLAIGNYEKPHIAFQLEISNVSIQNSQYGRFRLESKTNTKEFLIKKSYLSGYADAKSHKFNRDYYVKDEDIQLFIEKYKDEILECLKDCYYGEYGTFLYDIHDKTLINQDILVNNRLKKKK